MVGVCYVKAVINTKTSMPMSEIDPRTLQLYNEEDYLFNEVTGGEADLLMLDTYLTDLFKTKQR